MYKLAERRNLMLSVKPISFCGPGSRSSYGSSSDSSADITRHGSNSYSYRGGAPSERISNRGIRNLATRHPVQYEQFVNSLDDASREVASQVRKTIKHKHI